MLLSRKNSLVFVLILLFYTTSAQDVINSTASERVGFTWGQDNRSTSTLLQSCLIALLSCTWTVIHMNIPAPHDGLWTLFKRKLKWMIITLLAPEVTCSVAMRQWQESRMTVDMMNKRGIKWSISHGFYATMGGYVLQHENITVPLIPSEIATLIDDSNITKQFRLPHVTEKSIRDRSKTNGFTKFFTLVQATWLVNQCIVRAVGDFPVSQLEISTIAFIACTFIASGFWWKKPLDIETHTPFIYEGKLPESLQLGSKGWEERKVLQRVKMTTRIITRGSQKSMFFNLVLPFFFFGTIFSGIHLAAWNFDFATTRERSLWRVFGLIATLAPIAIAGSLQLASSWDPAVHNSSQEEIASPELAALVVFCYFASLLLYISARLVLLFQVFYCLRSMPVGMYMTVPWINFIPHA